MKKILIFCVSIIMLFVCCGCDSYKQIEPYFLREGSGCNFTECYNYNGLSEGLIKTEIVYKDMGMSGFSEDIEILAELSVVESEQMLDEFCALLLGSGLLPPSNTTGNCIRLIYEDQSCCIISRSAFEKYDKADELIAYTCKEIDVQEYNNLLSKYASLREVN